MLSLQFSRWPYVPPAGAAVKVTIVSLVAVEPGATVATRTRLPRSSDRRRTLGRTAAPVTSVGGLLGSSVMRVEPAATVMAPLHRPPRTLMGVPPFSENWKRSPDMPFADDAQTSSLPTSTTT